MTRQWIRRYSLTVSSGSRALDLSDLRFRFTIKQATIQAPNLAEITVTNVSDETARMIQAEFDKVTLTAGYEGNEGVIFKGNIKQSFRGRENPTDTYLFLNCADGDEAYNFGVVNQTLAAGSTPKDIVDTAAKAMKEHGVSLGFVSPDLSSPRYPRPVVMLGMARDFLRSVALSKGATWSIQNGEIQIVEKEKTIPGDVVLNSMTGLIGLPVQTFSGILARCLINPQIRVHSTVVIDQKSIQKAKLDLGFMGLPDTPNNLTLPSIASDGRYKVLMIEMTGDTRGQDWYMDLTCLDASNQTTFNKGLFPYLGGN